MSAAVSSFFNNFRFSEQANKTRRINKQATKVINAAGHKQGIMFKLVVSLENYITTTSAFIPTDVRERRKRRIKRIRRKYKKRKNKKLSTRDKERIDRLSKSFWKAEEYCRRLKIVLTVVDPKLDKPELLTRTLASLVRSRQEKWSWRHLDSSDRKALEKKVFKELKMAINPEGVYQKLKRKFNKNIDKLFVKIKKAEG